MSSFGLTSSFAIAVSLLVSFTLTPMLAARLIKRSDDEKERALEYEHRSPRITVERVAFYRPVRSHVHETLDVVHGASLGIRCVAVIVIFSIVPLLMFVGRLPAGRRPGAV
jgi:HAE1 family hydrophobic/amphiphilic exporter-1